MDAVILAGGKGIRMLPLTQSTPKPLLNVRDKPILEWILLSLRPTVSHVFIVVHYLKEQIIRFMKNQTIFDSYSIIEQTPEPLGTGHGLQCCAPYLNSQEFLVTNGDDLCSASGFYRLAQIPLGVLAVERNDPMRWGVLVTNEAGHLVRIHEKPPQGQYRPPVLANAGVYKLNSSVFDYPLSLSQRGEYEITDYFGWLVKNNTVQIIQADFWLPIGSVQDLEQAQLVDIDSRLFNHPVAR